MFSNINNKLRLHSVTLRIETVSFYIPVVGQVRLEDAHDAVIGARDNHRLVLGIDELKGGDDALAAGGARDREAEASRAHRGLVALDVVDVDERVLVGHEEHVIVGVELAVDRVVDVLEHDRLVHGLWLGPRARRVALHFVVVEELAVLVEELDGVDVGRAADEELLGLLGRLGGEQGLEEVLATPGHELGGDGGRVLLGIGSRISVPVTAAGRCA